MSSAENPYRVTWDQIAAQAPADERAGFIRKTYLHLAGAVFCFAALEAVFQVTIAPQVTQMLGTSRGAWLFVMLGFMAVSWIANSWAQSNTSATMQYLGLGLYVVAEAVIFVPLLYIASLYGGADIIPAAGIITLIIFGGLTAIVFITGKDFSFLRAGLMFAGFAAIGVMICAMIFHFQLGPIFCAAMVALAGGYILYDTSNVIHRYRVGQHVAASLALFASVALLFWYVLQLLMTMTNRR